VTEGITQFAFCYPWSYTKNESFLESLEKQFRSKKDIYYHREPLIRSKDHRKLELITISSFEGITATREPMLKGLFNGAKKRPFIFTKNKIGVFITARVHPGETPGSYMMNGILKFLTSNDTRAVLLRKNFIFKIIPIINTDGVYRGYYRYDTNSLNMNRHYSNPNIKVTPEIYGIKKIFEYYASEKRIKYYFDLHACNSSKGMFVFGNALEYQNHIENCMIPKLIEINSEFLKFEDCNFKESSMRSKGKGDKQNKEGTGRVFFYRKFDIIHSYTIEASYFKSLAKNSLVPINTNNTECNLNNIEYDSDFDDGQFLTPFCYEKMGIALLISLLDYEEINPFSRISNTEYCSIENLRKSLSLKLISEEDRFKHNLLFLNMAKDITRYKRQHSINEKNLRKGERLPSIKVLFKRKVGNNFVIGGKENNNLINVYKSKRSNTVKVDIVRNYK
jgi:hypothetical protein